MSQRIGILGLGEMGGMAARLLLARDMAVSAVDRPSAAWLPEAGGTLVADAKTLAAQSDIVILLLATEDAVEDAIFGDKGLAAGAGGELIVADMGTFAVALKERVRDALEGKGAIALDTPISGTPQAMETGRAVIMLSGDEAACDQVRPVLEALAPKCPFVGPFGHGMKLKFVLNALVTNHVLVTAEALNMGIASGLDPQQIIDVVKPSVATSTQFELRGPLMAERKWDPPTAPARLVLKDTHYIVDHARALGVPAPVSTITRDYYDKVAEMGLLDKELAIIFEALEADNEVTD
ncbi:MAG: NAD(P)-dependent oxidoreductase [Rhodospirillaceae bacterium]|jgi:L-threonate 2-dehydrogenase|nr:NAD(P)-dependent oxidoreductase [Rhodospirillaceae bacterium]MBT5945629.1 NAD(P)-dependent oxidoreductase [Rhodospirillaceae bacterium]MBT6404617.1 NAD(P)-dependent oxidoreductase [Rhodospirillaceae bacterium]MBT6535320.1 NAD(P)-dependent oxidoreductase [Rhodospirillaceae bacterium]